MASGVAISAPVLAVLSQLPNPLIAMSLTMAFLNISAGGLLLFCGLFKIRILTTVAAGDGLIGLTGLLFGLILVFMAEDTAMAAVAAVLVATGLLIMAHAVLLFMRALVVPRGPLRTALESCLPKHLLKKQKHNHNKLRVMLYFS